MSTQRTFTAKPLSLGFIGGSLQSAVGYAHHVSAAMDNQWALVAGCFTRNGELNRATGESYGVNPERIYQDWQHMLTAEKGRLDAIVILTPTPTHCEIVTACLAADFPVICEKALAATSTEAERIIAVRDAAKGFLAVTYNYSGYPMVRELKRIIEQGRLGRILHFQVEMPQEGFIRVDPCGNKPKPQSWRLQDGNVPTIYLDLAVHLHHLIYFLTGHSPLAVIADQDSYGWFPEIVDNVIGLCRYRSGMHGQVWFSKSALGCRNGLRLRIYGSLGSAEWYQANPEDLLVSHADGRREIVDRAADVELASMRRYNRFKAGHPAGFVEAFANLYADIAGCLQQYRATGEWRSSDVFGAELAFEGLAMAEAMVKSVETKSWQLVGTQHDEIIYGRQFDSRLHKQAHPKKRQIPERL